MRIQEFDYTVDLLEAIIWQYNQSTNVLSLLDQKQTWYNLNQTTFWTNWYEYVFYLSNPELTTSTDPFLQALALFGTVVWSIILGEPLLVPLSPESSNKPIWGFNLYTPSFPTLENSYKNFSYANFSTFHQNGLIELTVEQQQFLLRLRYFDLTTRGDIPDINYFLAYLLSTSNIGYDGSIYALDGFNMTMRYVFTKPGFPAGLLQALIYYGGLDILPRPATVGYKIVTATENTWGFNAYEPDYPNVENSYTNFSNGNFFTGVYPS